MSELIMIAKGIGGFLLFWLCVHLITFVLLTIGSKMGKCKGYGESVKHCLDNPNWEDYS